MGAPKHATKSKVGLKMEERVYAHRDRIDK